MNYHFTINGVYPLILKSVFKRLKNTKVIVFFPSIYQDNLITQFPITPLLTLILIRVTKRRVIDNFSKLLELVLRSKLSLVNVFCNFFMGNLKGTPLLKPSTLKGEIHTYRSGTFLQKCTYYCYYVKLEISWVGLPENLPFVYTTHRSEK